MFVQIIVSSVIGINQFSDFVQIIVSTVIVNILSWCSCISWDMARGGVDIARALEMEEL